MQISFAGFVMFCNVRCCVVSKRLLRCTDTETRETASLFFFLPRCLWLSGPRVYASSLALALVWRLFVFPHVVSQFENVCSHGWCSLVLSFKSQGFLNLCSLSFHSWCFQSWCCVSITCALCAIVPEERQLRALAASHQLAFHPSPPLPVTNWDSLSHLVQASLQSL